MEGFGAIVANKLIHFHISHLLVAARLVVMGMYRLA